jgi:hypothetical protein
MLSSTTFIILGIIVLVSVIIVWKFWKKPIDKQIQDLDTDGNQKLLTNNEPTGPPSQSQQNTTSPPMVFAVNDNGNLDLTDINGNILNIHFGPNPKTYINLLDTAEKDTTKVENSDGTIYFTSNVGSTKYYEILGNPYIINYTQL